MNRSAIVGELFISQTIGMESIAIEQSYDLTIAALSWEQRSASALKAAVGFASDVALIRFASSDEAMNKLKTDRLGEFQELAFPIRIIDLDHSTMFYENSLAIEKLVVDEVIRRGRPIRILLDISCIPKSYLLFMVGLVFKKSYASKLVCLYSEGLYALDVSHADLHSDAAAKMGIISEGEWSSLQIPYLESEYAFPVARDLFVSMGGEVGLSLPFLDRYEPRNLGLVLISESLVQTPSRLPAGEQLALQEILAEPNVVRSDVSLSDVVGIVEQASAFCEQTRQETVTAIAIGSKPHALGLGLVALGQAKMEVICRVPKRYRPLDVAPAGRFSIYEIEDRFEPTAFLIV